jgi:hypothetical protein
MKDKSIKKDIAHYANKLNCISNLYDKKELKISFDRLSHEIKVDYELLYFANSVKEEKKGIFVFSYEFFLKELKDQEIKKILSHNYLNFRIHTAYYNLIDGDKYVRMNDIINYLAKEDSSISRQEVLKRIFSLVYYHNWPLKKDENAIDPDYFIQIPPKFKNKLKQRFNLDILLKIKDNKNVLFFVNIKGDLILALKNYSYFTKDDLKKITDKYMKKEFGIKKISFEN